MRLRDVLMCSDRYADDIPLTLPKTQLPPTRSDASRQSNGTPRSCSALAAAMPDEPAPMTQVLGRWDIAGACPKVTQASSSVPGLDGGLRAPELAASRGIDRVLSVTGRRP